MDLFRMAVGEKKDQKYKLISKPKVELWSKNNEEAA